MRRASVISYGIIPLIRGKEGWQCFMIQHRKEHFWGFPKGHANPGETSVETAIRELFEETHLKVLEILDPTPLVEKYLCKEQEKLIEKTVQFYLATVSGHPKVDGEEVLQGRWLSLQQALGLITYPEGKQLMEEVIHLMSTRDFH